MAAPALEILHLPDSRAAVRRFVRFAPTVYADWPRWVTPLLGAQVAFIHRGPFADIGEKQLLLACRGGRPVARLSVHRSFAHNEHYGENQGFFGFFEALPDAEAVGALFRAGAAWLRARGCISLRGPMSFGIYDEIGLLLDGFDDDPAILCPYNPPYYAELLESVGLRKEIDWYSFAGRAPLRLPPMVDAVVRAIADDPETEIRSADMRVLRQQSEAVRCIFNEAWADNWGHVPMTPAQFGRIVHELEQVLHADLCLFAYHRGVPVGFIIGVPDLNPAIRLANGRLLPLGWWRIMRAARHVKRVRIMIMGVQREARKLGYHLALIRQGLVNGLDLGYDACDISQIVETNQPMLQLLHALGAERNKTFRIYSAPLAALSEPSSS